MINGNISSNYEAGDSRTEIRMIGQELNDSILVAQSINSSGYDNFNFNINYNFGDGKDKTTNFDIDYGLYRSAGKEFQPNQYYDATETEKLTKNVYRNETFTNIDIFTFKVDHERPLLKGKLGVGGKVAYITTDNDYNFYNVFEESSSEELDIDRSNQFVYTENVNAVYGNYTRQIEKIGYQIGLRVEQTNSEGILTSDKAIDDDNVKQNYVDFFPSAGITYQLNPKNSFQLSYSLRINRPNYQDLNPFEYKLDEITFQKGNPFLNPEYTNNIQPFYCPEACW
jgi:iron complex outermembrane recepter protein